MLSTIYYRLNTSTTPQCATLHTYWEWKEYQGQLNLGATLIILNQVLYTAIFQSSIYVFLCMILCTYS